MSVYFGTVTLWNPEGLSSPAINVMVFLSADHVFMVETEQVPRVAAQKMVDALVLKAGELYPTKFKELPFHMCRINMSKMGRKRISDGSSVRIGESAATFKVNKNWVVETL